MTAVDVRTLDDTMSVAGQITADQVQTLAEAGFKTIICNRPDGEAPDQPSHTEIEAAAKAAGVAFVYIPVLASGMTYDNVDATRATLNEVETPILAYCRSGARSTQVYGVATGKT